MGDRPGHLAAGTRALAVGASLIALVSCDAWVTKPSLYNSVEVVTTRRNGEPVAGVNLVLYTGQRPMAYGTTQPDGRFRFTLIPQGSYGVYAFIPPDYELTENLIGRRATNFVDGLIVAKDTLSPVRFSFLKRGPGNVVTRVVDGAGKPLGGVPAVLYSPARTLDSAVTNDSGLVTFRNVPFGAYGVSITRPPFFRSYQRYQDSLYSFRDAILVEEGSRDSARFVLPRCAGQVRFRVTDQRGDPVFAAMVSFYTTTEILGDAFTDRSGAGVFQAPCATGMGAFIYPPAGYVPIPGRGTQFFDGIVLTPGATRDLNYTVQKTP